MAKRKRLIGEIRFRVSRQDLQRIDWLQTNLEHSTVSALLRKLVDTAFVAETAIAEVMKHEKLDRRSAEDFLRARLDEIRKTHKHNGDL